MVAAASALVAPPHRTMADVSDLRLRAVEQRLLELTRAGIIGPAYGVARRLLRANGDRLRARLTILAADGVGLRAEDGIALATCAELVFAAAETDAPSDDGQLLLSAAYAALASITDPACIAHLIGAVHRALAADLAGRCHSAAVADVFVADYDIYERVAVDQLAPLLGLPLELVLICAGLPQFRGRARRVVTNLALASRITEDLITADQKAGHEWRPTCLNVVTVLESAGFGKPRLIASANAYAALRTSIRHARKLPRGVAGALHLIFEYTAHGIAAASA